jgi:hypothetical protein
MLTINGKRMFIYIYFYYINYENITPILNNAKLIPNNVRNKRLDNSSECLRAGDLAIAAVV